MGRGFAKPGHSVRKHLYRKVKHCDDARTRFTKRLGNAQGNDIFKYMLILNCIECQSYVAEVELQAHRSFRRCSICAAVFAFILVTAAISAMIALPMFFRDVTIEIATISSISALMTTFISGVFFYLYRVSLGRMDEFHKQLREAQKIAAGLFVNGLSGSASQDNEQTTEILPFVRSTERAHPKAKEATTQAGPA
jgi:hypothetical protein